MTNTKLKKAACFTDIHFGRKANSQQHNLDCVNFITWFCDYVNDHPDIDHVVFMGDWHESRNALNIVTLKQSYMAARQINSLNLPVFFIVGNHDLYYKNSRDVYSVISFHEFSNFNVIDEPTILKETHTPTLLCPYLFAEEYPQLKKYRNVPIWMGHFEFKGFVVTGQTIKMPTGPNPDDFSAPRFIFSGHFHKRQQNKNVTYIGNTFPMDFSDVNDIDRGLMVFDYETQTTTFENWAECPKYIRTELSDLLNEKVQLQTNARVQCFTDEDLTYEEKTTIQKQYLQQYNLRDFVLQEITDINDTIALTEVDASIADSSLLHVDELVLQMLDQVNDKQVDNALLKQLYKQI